MKKWGIILFLVLCLVLAFDDIGSIFQNQVEIQDYEPDNWSVESIQVSTDQVYQGNLLLVNHDFPVRQESIKEDVVNIISHKEFTNGFGLLNNEIYLSEEVSRAFSEMIAAAEKDGVGHFSINSGFRDFEEQSALYHEMGSDYALPAGFSEHNLGLSLDVGSTQMRMEDAPEGKWIEKNAWKYGFILRYPKDKTEVTGIQYEPWHIRYVGIPHSAIMKEKNLALEEYMDYLKEERQIAVSIDGEEYTVSYYPVSESMTIDVPDTREYEISGNNVDGVIVTVYE
jgi:zinc D-Ala-D-Ala carboxypeptidase